MMNKSATIVLGLVLAGLALVHAIAAPAPAADHSHKGERQLGSKEIAGYTVKVIQESDVKPGEEGAFAIELSGKDEKPKAIRAWVGDHSAAGSVKMKAVPEGKEWHAHVEVPRNLPSNAQFWVEIETARGKTKGAFDYKK